MGANDYGVAGQGWSGASNPQNYWVNGWSSVSQLPDGQAKTVRMSQYHACAIDLNDQPWCWGRNEQGQLGNGAFSESAQPQKVVGWTGKATALTLGHQFTCALRDDGKAFCWGYNNNGQLGDGSAYSHVPAPVLGLP